jgi:hypothetical protein
LIIILIHHQRRARHPGKVLGLGGLPTSSARPGFRFIRRCSDAVGPPPLIRAGPARLASQTGTASLGSAAPGPVSGPLTAGCPGVPDAWHDLCCSSPGFLPFRTICARGVTHDTAPRTDVGPLSLVHLPGSGAWRQTVHVPRLSLPSPGHRRGGRARAEYPSALPRRSMPAHELSPVRRARPPPPSQACRWSWSTCERSRRMTIRERHRGQGGATWP